MSGGNIHCGSFEADDKSGSAFESVINEISLEIQEISQDVKDQLDENEYVLLSCVQAKDLINPLERYRDELIKQIGHDNWSLEVENEENAGMDSVDGKWGASRGWRLYCVNNLIEACKTSIKENEPICVAFS